MKMALHRASAWRHGHGNGRFVSADGQLALHAELDDTGDARHVRLAMPAAWR